MKGGQKLEQGGQILTILKFISLFNFEIILFINLIKAIALYCNQKITNNTVIC